MNTNLSSEDINALVDMTNKYNSLENRVTNEPIGSSKRHIFSQDYSRILYSTSFRRLQGKMQFLSVASNQFYRNRLTHSLEVVQIARTIAGAIRSRVRSFHPSISLYGADMYVIESACLAHDIGNPPFGHAGERVLNELMKFNGGYEGNAQTFRVLNTLERRFPNEKGLYLSKRTLLSVVKYFKKGESNDKFLYDADYEKVRHISESSGVSVRTLDAQIMDIADEIAYAAHDLEDALRLKLFTIDDLLFEFRNSEKYGDAYDTLKDIVDSAKSFAMSCNSDSSEDYYFFFTKQLTSLIVNTLVVDISWVEVSEKERKETGTNNSFEIGYKNHSKLALGLKKLNFKCISRKPEILLYEKKGETIITGLFRLFSDYSFNKELKLLPVEYRNLLKSGDSGPRVICDYISGMMDTYAIELYLKYFGKNSLDKYFKDQQD